MRKRKSTVLWVMVFVFVAAVSAGNEAWAASATCLVGNNVDLPSGQCVNLSGYDVKVAKGAFPKYTNGNSIFKWVIVPVQNGVYRATKNLNLIDIKFPAAIQTGTFDQLKNSMKVSIIKPSPLILSYDFDKDDDDEDDQCGSPVNCMDLPFKGTGTGTTPGWYLYKAGQGDPATGLGKGEFDHMVLKVIPPAGCSITTTGRGKIRVRFENRLLFAGLNTFLVRAEKAEGWNLLGPSMSSQATSPTDQPAIRSGESFALGNTGCTMQLTFNSDGSVAKAVVLPTDPNNDPGICGDGTPLPIGKISAQWDCDNDGGIPVNCKKRKSVEQSIMEEDEGSCTYKYTTKTGQTVTKTITGTATCP